MSIFNLKKDIQQIKQTGKKFKETGEEIEKKAPLVASTSKSVFVIIKWLILLGVIAGIILAIVMFLVTKEREKQNAEYNKQWVLECIEREYPTYYHHSGIEGCIFWTRHGYLEETQVWASLFKKDEAYCSQKYKNGSGLLLPGEYSDPKCQYQAFREQKRNENWAYLTSKEKDGIYYYCVDKICPSPNK